MKNKTQNIWGKTLATLLLIATLFSCSDMLSDPTVDKETGEDLNLLILDFNFFKTRMSFKMVDVTDNSPIMKDATLTFSGRNANDIVDFAGKKEAQRFTSQGQMELTVDPTVDFSESTPLEFTVHVSIDGYDDFSQYIEIKSEGKKTYELVMSPVSGGTAETLNGTDNGDSFVFSKLMTKSAALTGEKPYQVIFSITKTDMIKFTDENGLKLFNTVDELMTAYKQNPSNFFQFKTDVKTGFPARPENVWNGESRQLALFRKMESGNLVALVIGGQEVKNMNGGVISQNCTYTETPAPDLFGFVSLQNNAWSFSTGPVVYNTLNVSYQVASATLDALCSSGANINFTAGFSSSFSIDADIFDAAGKLIRTLNFKGKFPESFLLEDVPSEAGRIVFRNNNPAFREIAPLEISNLCSGDYEVEVDAVSGYQEYQVVLKAFCPDNPSVAVAPTYSGEIRIKNSDDPWQGVDLIGGVVDFLAKPKQEYQLRFLWKDEWQVADYHTKFDANGNYLEETDLNISSKLLDDGRIRILVQHNFEQYICDDLNW